MKIIDHNFPELIQINSPQGRLYRTPDGVEYPSVTTVLGQAQDNSYLEEWRSRVGDAEADRVSKEASDRGSFIHTCCELYIKGLPVNSNPFDYVRGPMFKAMIPYLDEFEEVHALETRMFSDNMQVAGTVDAVAMIGGKLTVVDYKTSSRIKYAQDIPTYFLQCAAYAMMFYEHTKIPVHNIRVIMTTVDDGVLIFDEKVKNWIYKFKELRNSLL